MSSKQRDEELRKLIRVILAEYNYSKPQLAICLGCSYNTLLNKIKKPDTLTYPELRTLFKMKKLPPEKIAELM